MSFLCVRNTSEASLVVRNFEVKIILPYFNDKTGLEKAQIWARSLCRLARKHTILPLERFVVPISHSESYLLSRVRMFSTGRFADILHLCIDYLAKDRRKLP